MIIAPLMTPILGVVLAVLLTDRATCSGACCCWPRVRPP
jgi:hypothetical protein